MTPATPHPPWCPYIMLEIEPDATEEEIRQAHRRAAKKWHPDVGGDAVMFALTEQAYRIVGNPQRRAAYDTAHGHTHATQPTATPPPAAAPPQAATGRPVLTAVTITTGYLTFTFLTAPAHAAITAVTNPTVANNTATAVTAILTAAATYLTLKWQRRRHNQPTRRTTVR